MHSPAINSEPSPARIYLDNAATSWPKPEAVYAAVDQYQRQVGAPAGRSGYAEAVAVSQAIAQARLQLSKILGHDDPTHLIFTSNGTDSLNLAIHGLLRTGDHVITSVVEHNSVLRPLSSLESAGLITVTRVSCNQTGVIDPDDIRAALRPATRLIALTHASNVTGAIQPISEIGQIAREADVPFLCDAAQTVGHMPVDMAALGVDLLAASGHKGLMGPLGTGILAIRPQVARQMRSVRQGGTGTESEQTRQPDDLPAKFESGNLNVLGILGLAAGVNYLQQRGVDAVEQHGRQLTGRLLAGLRAIEGVRIVGSLTPDERAPLVSVVLEGYDPQEVAMSLDTAYRIQVRPGLHCAPLVHEALRTAAGGGTVRFSLGAFTTAEEIDAAVLAVAEIAASQVTI